MVPDSETLKSDSHSGCISLSIAIPFYNEEPNVVSVIKDIVTVLESKGILFEILAVDNGSSDATGNLIASMHEQDKRIVPVRVPVNKGYGFGILAGLGKAKGGVLGYTWGDGQVSAADLLRIFEALLEKDAHIGKAHRTERHDGLFRLIQTRCYSVVFTILFGCRVPDPNGCPKLFARSAYERIAPASHDWLLDPEIMIKARRLGLDVVNVPVVFQKRKHAGSKVRIFTAIGFIWGLVKIRLGMR